MDLDFALCNDDDCPSHRNCFRWSVDNVVPGQSFFDPERKKEEEKCKYFVHWKWGIFL